MESDGYKFPVIGHNVLTDKDCEYIKNKAESLLSQARVPNSKYINLDIFKCESAKLSHKEDDVLRNIVYKITKNTSNCEEIEVMRFKPGDFTKLIEDGCSYVTNKRVKSYYIPLVKITDYEGGEILFESINRIYKLDIGSVLSFDTINEDGITPLQAKHSHEPVTSGEKWLCKMYIRENEISDMDDNVNLKLSYSRMTLDDIDEIISIQMYCCDKDLGNFLNSDLLTRIVNDCPDLALIARDENGNIVGGVIGVPTKGKPCLENMYVLNDPEADHIDVQNIFVKTELKGRGVGRQLSEYYYNEWIINRENGTHRPIKFCFVHTVEEYREWTESIGFRVLGLSDDIRLPNGEPYIQLIMDVEERMK
jgi:predicted GNAT family acetyltransferase